MAVTQNTYTGNGSTTNYSFTFPYLETTDIKVSLNGTVTTAYTLANATTVQFNTAPANGAAIRIYRETDDSNLQATFYPGSAIRSSDLNDNFTQNLYVTQEANNVSAAATTTANTALTNSNTAISTANSAVSTANTASSNASAAVSTANTASSNASAAVSTANTASTNASAAVSTANSAAANAATALSTANTALSTANTASTNASAAVSTANTASSNASAAVSTANTASSNASSAVTTANNAVTTANSAVSTANSATSTANTALSTANAAASAVANAILYDIVANVAAIPGSPANNKAVEVVDSTGIESFTPLANKPAGFTGSSGLSVRIVYTTTGNTWNWIQYFPNDPESRYLKLSGGTLTGQLKADDSTSVASPVIAFDGDTNTGIAHTGADELALVTGGTARLTVDPSGNVAVAGGLTKGGNNVVTIGDTGTVTSTMIADGTIVNADVNASAAIAGTKVSPDFGAQNVTTTGTSTAASFIPTSSSAPTNGVYLPAANSVAISTNSSQRLLIDASGNVNIDSNTLYVDATNNRVGIGTTTAGRTLSVDSSIQISNATSGWSLGNGLEILHEVDGESYFINRRNGNIRFHTNNTERVRLDASGRLLVGTSTARNKFFNTSQDSLFQVEGVSGGSQVISHTYGEAGNGGPYLVFTKNRSGTIGGTTVVNDGDQIGAVSFQGSDGSEAVEAARIQAFVDGAPGANDMPGRLVFSTCPDSGSSPVERLRITNNGNVFINSTSNPAVGTEMFGVAAQASGQTIAAGFANTVNTSPTVFIVNNSNTTNTFLMRFVSGSGGNTRGEIYYNGSQLVYATSSDYRLKENVQPFSGGIDIVKQLRPVKYNWIENGNEDIGFIAHEVQEVFPNAVGGQKDAVDEDGRILPQTYDPSKLVPLLTAALQEAIGEIESLKARVAALESA